jgi:hypothetical protein
MADTAYFNGETVLDGIPRKQFQVVILHFHKMDSFD